MKVGDYGRFLAYGFVFLFVLTLAGSNPSLAAGPPGSPGSPNSNEPKGQSGGGGEPTGPTVPTPTRVSGAKEGIVSSGPTANPIPAPSPESTGSGRTGTSKTPAIPLKGGVGDGSSLIPRPESSAIPPVVLPAAKLPEAKVEPAAIPVTAPGQLIVPLIPSELEAEVGEAAPPPPPGATGPEIDVTDIIQTVTGITPAEPIKASVVDLEQESKIYLGISLPPMMEAFLTTLLSVVELDPVDETGLFAPPKAVDPIKLNNFSRVLKMLAHIYGDSAENPRPAYSGKPITSLRGFFEATEPTRGHSGTVQGDTKKLMAMVERWEKDPSSVPRAPLFDLNENSPHFAHDNVRFAAALALETRARHFRSLMLSAAAGVGTDAASSRSVGRSIMEEVFKSFALFFINPKNAALALKEIIHISERPVIAEMPAPDANMNPKHPFHEATRILEQLDAFGRSEGGIVTFVEGFARLKPGDLWEMVELFQGSMGGIVKELRAVGSRAAESDKFQALKEGAPDHFKMLTAIFDDYPKRYSAATVKNIIMDLIRMPQSTSDYSVLKIVLMHGDSMLLETLQKMAHQDVLGPYRYIFEELQKANRPTPFEVVWETILADPNHYEQGIELIDPIPIATGKAFQIHRARYRGQDKAIRVQRPGVDAALDYAMDTILPPMMERLADFFFPPGGTSADRRSRMQRIFQKKYRNLKREQNVYNTVRVQNQAKAEWQHTYRENVEGLGTIEVEIIVPGAEAAVEDSVVQVMDWVSNTIPYKKFKAQNPLPAAAIASTLQKHLFQKLLFDPLSKRIEGFGHGDLHTENIMYGKPYTKPGNNFPTFPVYPVDWGIVSTVSPDQVEWILVLAFGGGLWQDYAVTDALWNLRNSSAGEFGLTYSELKARVKAQIKKLKKARMFWGAEQWIRWSWMHGYLEFPDTMLELYDTKMSLDDLQEGLGNGKGSYAKFMAGLEREYRWTVTKLVKQRYPWYRVVKWSSVGLALTQQVAGDCAAAVGRYLNPPKITISPDG